jgi:hypothetical protein
VADDTWPDDGIDSVNIPDDDEAPEIYAVSDLRAYVKPDLDEELGAPTGEAAVCGTEVVCSCVPVDTCACNTVSYLSGGSTCPTDCSCEGQCVSLYWYPT